MGSTTLGNQTVRKTPLEHRRRCWCRSRLEECPHPSRRMSV